MNQINVNGFKIGVKAWGDPSNPMMLAMHGWLDNAASFDLLAPYLDDYYLLAIDLPGHGHSQHYPANSHYHFIDGVFFIHDLLNALEVETIRLLGHSMGACLASMVAAVIPERISHLGLIEGLGPLSRSEDETLQQLQNYVDYQQKIAKRHKKFYPSLEQAAQARQKSGYLSYQHALTLVTRGSYEDQGNYYWRHDPRLISPSPLRLTENQVLVLLKGIKCPTSLIWADNGFDFNQQAMQKRIQCVPQLKVTQLSGGHHIHMESPSHCADVLNAFFR